MAINRKSNFGVEGFRLQRNNPDGTIPTYSNMLGCVDGLDVSGLAGTETITYKANSDAEVTEAIDLTGGAYADSSNATVAEIFAELNVQIALGSLNLTASADVGTGRLKLAATAGTPNKLQIYGTLISFLGFGKEASDSNDIVETGIGLRIVNGFDTTKSIGLPKNLKDKEEIENESGDGTLTSVITNAIVKGLTPVLTCAKNDLELKWLIMGGVYDPTANTFEPPTIEEQTTKPTFNMEVFSPEYDQGSNLRTGIAGWEQVTVRNCTGYEGDGTKETKAFTDLIFNLDAAEYTNSSGVKSAAYTEKILTVAEYTALDVENV